MGRVPGHRVLAVRALPFPRSSSRGLLLLLSFTRLPSRPLVLPLDHLVLPRREADAVPASSPRLLALAFPRAPPSHLVVVRDVYVQGPLVIVRVAAARAAEPRFLLVLLREVLRSGPCRRPRSAPNLRLLPPLVPGRLHIVPHRHCGLLLLLLLLLLAAAAAASRLLDLLRVPGTVPVSSPLDRPVTVQVVVAGNFPAGSVLLLSLCFWQGNSRRPRLLLLLLLLLAGKLPQTSISASFSTCYSSAFLLRVRCSQTGSVLSHSPHRPFPFRSAPSFTVLSLSHFPFSSAFPFSFPLFLFPSFFYLLFYFLPFSFFFTHLLLVATSSLFFFPISPSFLLSTSDAAAE